MSAIIPAILPRSLHELEDTLARLGEGAFVQIDAVDGHFAEPASWPYSTGEALPEQVEGLTRCRFDADLMVEEPEEAVGTWLRLGAERLTLHLESMPDASAALERIKSTYGHETKGICAFELGLAVGMESELAALEPHLAHVDYVQLMGIDTVGRQGEPFDKKVIERVRTLRETHPKLIIQVDGGISLTSAKELFAAGADRLVVGHAIVGAHEPQGVWHVFEGAAQGHARQEEKGYTGPMVLADSDIGALAEKANEIRETLIEMLIAAKSGHTAGPLGLADIFTAFYFHILAHDPKNPEWEGRDRLILSNGHCVPVRYATMAHAGYFSLEECLTLRKFGSRLQGHPERMRLPGLETTSGPLGEGLAQAAGMAYALRMDKKSNRIYCIMSDGEQEEGNTWEAAMFAGKYKLGNLTAVMDRNNIQIDGMTEDVMPLEPIADKYRAFNWHVLEVNGHDIGAFIAAVEEAKAIYEKPVVIIAHTIPGKGIKEIEFDHRWHGSPPGGGPEDVWKKAEQGKATLKELRTLGGKLKHEYA